MSKPQVTLTFAGDDTKLSRTFDSVGQAARRTESEVGAASRGIAKEAGDGFDRAGEAADAVDTKAMGFRDTMTGVQDTMSGASMIAKGDLFNGFLTLGTGIGDLGSGLYNFLIPTLKSMSTQMLTGAVSTARATAASLAQRGAALATAAATNVMAVAQRGLNLAMRANPIGLIITALLALTAGVIWAYKNVGWFRSAVDTAMRGVRTAFGWAIDAGGRLVGWVRGLPGAIGGYLNAVPTAGRAMLSWFQSIPGKIGGYFSGLASTITAPYRAAFAGIRTAWNNTVGGKGFDVPGWVPGVGGRSFRIPYFHTGGIVPGGLGSETLAVLKAGEKVTSGSNSASAPVVLVSDGSKLGDLLLEVLRKSIRAQGGDVQAVLGP